jgi:hypothetical protein
MKKAILYSISGVLMIVLLLAGAVGYFDFGTPRASAQHEAVPLPLKNISPEKLELMKQQMRRSIAQLDAVPLSPANYKPAAVELVKLCQSDPSLFSEQAVEYLTPFAPIWAPPSVAKLKPETIDIHPDHARVTWGGGFYHCGWTLVRGQAAADGSSYAWTLSFYSEDQQNNRVLQTLEVPKDQRFTKDEFIHYVLAAFDDRLTTPPDAGPFTDFNDRELATARCLFLQHHHRLDLLPAQVRKTAAGNPHDWCDALLAYMLNHAAGDRSAAARLRRWADQATGPGAWLYAAYAFYRTRDTTAGDDAVKRAIANKSPDPEWMDYEIPEIELGMAARLYRSGDFKSCVNVCDGILSSRHRLFTNKASVQRLRDAAAAPSPAAKPPAFERFASVDPFDGFDLDLLHTAATTSAAPGTQP